MIIVGVDGSDTARAAVRWAADDAARRRLPLRIVHALERWPYEVAKFPSAGWPDAQARAAQEILDGAAAAAREHRPGVEPECLTIAGTPAEVLLEQAEEAAEIVIGSRGLGGFTGALLGSVSADVAGQARCPVVVVRADQDGEPREIVAGVDASDACEPALGYAFDQARLRRCRLRAIHAWQLPVHAYAPGASYDLDEIHAARQEILTGRLAPFRKEYPDVRVAEDVHHAHPVDALAGASAHADLVAVGSRGRGAVEAALLGSVSRGILYQAHCAVAVVR